MECKALSKVFHWLSPLTSVGQGSMIERSKNSRKIVPLYAARPSDLAPGDLVQVECGGGRDELLTPTMLRTAGVGPDDRIVGLAPRLRCRECDERGKVVVSIKWGRLLDNLSARLG